MSRVIVYGPDGSVQSAYDTSGTSATASAPSNGANGTIAATSITNSGTTNLQGALGVAGPVSLGAGLTLTGGTLTFADGSTQNTAGGGGGGGSTGPSNGATGAIQASSITNSGNTSLTGTLAVQGASTLASLSAASLTLQSGGNITFADGSTQSVAYTGSVSNSNGATGSIQASSITNSGNTSLQGTLSVAALSTLAGATLSSGKLTFADGTSIATAPTQQSGASGAIQATSITNSGDTSLSGKLTVGGTSTFNGAVNAIGLTVQGSTNLQQGLSVGQNIVAVGNVSANKVTAGSDITGSGNLNVSSSNATATLGATSVTTLNATGASTLAGLSAGTSTLGNTTVNNLTLATNGKVTFADGTTQATASSGSGSQGPQGAPGPGMRYGYGPPTSTNPSYQIDNDFYRDLNTYLDYGPRSGGVWPTTPYNVNGPTGPAGFTSLPNATLVPGPNLVAGGVTVSSTPYVMTAPGTTNINQTYYPQGPSALMGLGYVNFSTIAVTAELYDVTASKSIYTVSMAASSYVSTAVFSTTQYPMTAGNQHVWRLTGSGTATVQLAPCYLSASSTNTPALSVLQGFTTAPSTAFTSTALDVLAFGVSGNKQRNVMVVRPTSVVGIIGNYTASASGAAAASVTVTIGYYNPSGGSVTILVTTTASIPNTGVTTNVGNYSVGQYVVPAATCLFARVQGSGTGQVNLDLQIVE